MNPGCSATVGTEVMKNYDWEWIQEQMSKYPCPDPGRTGDERKGVDILSD
jgi:hypothetical protein